MNQCEDRHEPKYRIKYKPAKGNRYSPEWIVCEACFENKNNLAMKMILCPLK